MTNNEFKTLQARIRAAQSRLNRLQEQYRKECGQSYQFLDTGKSYTPDYEKTVTLEIEIPVTFAYVPEEPGYFHGQTYSAEVDSIDFKLEDAESAIIEALEDPGLMDELLEHAEAENRRAKEDAIIAQWEDRQIVNETFGRR